MTPLKGHLLRMNDDKAHFYNGTRIVTQSYLYFLTLARVVTTRMVFLQWLPECHIWPGS